MTINKDKPYLVTPDEYELNEFFLYNPVVKDEDNWYWAYEYKDKNNCMLRFSCDTYQFIIQTDLLYDNQVLMSISHKHANHMEFKDQGKILLCTFGSPNEGMALELRLSPYIQCNWFNLIE